MLLVKTIIKQSTIAGIGLFADEDILKNAKIWIFSENIDRKFSQKDIELSPPVVQEQIRIYSYLSKASKLYIYPADNGRFMNHSSNPNVDVVFTDESEEDVNIAARDIAKGEELMINYEKFDQEFASYKDTYKWYVYFQSA